VVGLGTISYSLTSIKYHVFDKGAVQMDELLDALKSDFAGRYEMFATGHIEQKLPNTAKMTIMPTR